MNISAVDISSASYVPMYLSGIPVPRSVRTGALFIFRGGLEEYLVTSPDLEVIIDEEKGRYIFLTFQFASRPGLIYEKLELLEVLKPAFVIARWEEENKNPGIVGPVASWEQGYLIEGVIRMTESRMILAVKRGERANPSTGKSLH
jgi:hypothetical protein